MTNKDVRKQLQKQIRQMQMLYLGSICASAVSLVFLIWFGIPYLLSGASGELHSDVQAASSEKEVGHCEHERLLDGRCVDTEEKAHGKLVAIMIENHPDARPLSGLAKASVVYEAPVEANYTRFLALYPEDADVSKAGPVRSARPYYLDWVQEYGNPLYMHVGGSPDALARIVREGIFDINEMGRGWYFWRSEDRSAPHNTYTAGALWKKAIDDYWQEGFATAFDPWTFSSLDPCTADCVNEMTVTFLLPSYEAVWKYDAETETYARYQSGVPHWDDDGTPIVANTIIVQQVKTRVVDDVGRLEMDTIGSGEATVFRGGHAIEARWEKENRTGRTRWLDQDGNDIPLAPGTIWIEVVGTNNHVSIKPL